MMMDSSLHFLHSFVLSLLRAYYFYGDDLLQPIRAERVGVGQGYITPSHKFRQWSKSVFFQNNFLIHAFDSSFCDLNFAISHSEFLKFE